MKQFTVPLLVAGTALTVVLFQAFGDSDVDRPATEHGDVSNSEAAVRSTTAVAGATFEATPLPVSSRRMASATTAAEVAEAEPAEGPVLRREYRDSTTGMSSDILGHTRSAPARVKVEHLEQSSDVNPTGAEFSKELRQEIQRDLENYRATFAKLEAEASRVEAQEFAAAAASGFATRKAVNIDVDELGSETFSVPIGVVGEESEIVFGDDGVEVVRVPTQLMAKTNAVRSARLAEWLEFWHAVLPRLEAGGHLKPEQSDAIYQVLHADFQGVLEGFGVSLEQLESNRKRRKR